MVGSADDEITSLRSQLLNSTTRETSFFIPGGMLNLASIHSSQQVGGMGKLSILLLSLSVTIKAEVNIYGPTSIYSTWLSPVFYPNSTQVDLIENANRHPNATRSGTFKPFESAWPVLGPNSSLRNSQWTWREYITSIRDDDYLTQHHRYQCERLRSSKLWRTRRQASTLRSACREHHVRLLMVSWRYSNRVG